MAKNITKKANKKQGHGVALRTMHYYWQAMKKYKWWAVGAFVFTPITIFIRNMWGPIVFADLIDKVSRGLSANEIVETSAAQVLVFLVSYIISKLLIDEARLYCCWKMQLLVIKDLLDMGFETVAEQSMQFHNNRFSGSLVSQTTKFAWGFERLTDDFFYDILPMLSYMAMVIFILAPRVPGYTIALVVLVVAYALISGLSFKKISHLNNLETESETKMTGQLADSITNIISVKSYAREAHERKRFSKFTNEYFTTSMGLMHGTINRDVKFGLVQIAIDAFIIIFLIYGREWLGITVATLVLIVNYTQTIKSELWSFNSIFKNINRAFGDAHEMTVILDTPDDVVDEPGAKPLVLENTSVEFKNMGFQHADAKEAIFEDFNLEVKPGERIGLVGISGSGKTTLTKLLMRFADVNVGEIDISGQNIKFITQKSLREAIAYVPQETSLFHRSIADNIAYGKLNASLKEIKWAAEQANANEFIEDLPEGYHTLVGERGVKLSGGQRQRVAIARAILKDAPILVLDEATSALDSESEALIQEALEKLMQGRTSIVIAHRLSTVASLDRIVVLEDGKIVEQGRHEELLQKPNGVYKHLWDRQSGAFME